MRTAYSREEFHELEAVLTEMAAPVGSDPAESVLALSQALESHGVPLADQAETARRLAAEWRVAVECPRLLRDGVEAAVSKSSSPHARAIAPEYFSLHGGLQSGLAMTFGSASIMIGHTPVIGDLAERHSMSAAQIATFLRSRGIAEGAATWAAVQKVLSAISLAPAVSPTEVESQIEVDLRAEERRFADADWAVALEIMATVGNGIGIEPEVVAHLADLAPESGDAHWPYVFMLHFSCVPLDWYDHAPVYLYEFRPRGQSAEKLLSRYRHFDVGSDPFLNNAKSVDRVDQRWADSKTRMGLRRPASALVTILEEVGALPFQAKRAYGAALRHWCLRQLRLQRGPGEPLASDLLEPEPLGRLLTATAASETNTRGIVEQRVVDALALAAHSAERWRARGLGDSVNAANTARRKLGDCEFQDSMNHRVEAYEARGGHLSQAYFDNHRATLERVMRRRLDDEWLAYSEASDWDVKVTFVAHTTDLSDPIEAEVEEVRVRFRFATYESLISGLDLSGTELRSSISKLVIDSLNHPRTPQRVRDRVATLSAP